MNKLPTVLLSLFALAGLGIVVWQHMALNELRGSNLVLQGRLDAIVSPGAVQEVPVDRREIEAEIAKLRIENQDLHKLRNEVRGLRQATQPLAHERTANERLKTAALQNPSNPSQPDTRPSFTRDSLKFAGYSSPEATLETMLWAMREGNLDVMFRCFTPEEIEDIRENNSEEDMKREMREEVGQLASIRIAAKRAGSNDTIVLGLQMNKGNEGHLQEQAIVFKLVGNEWRMSMGSR